MKEHIDRAKKVLMDWKGDSYTFGENVLDATGRYARRYGKRAALVVTELGQAWIEKPARQIQESLRSNGLSIDLVQGARIRRTPQVLPRGGALLTAVLVTG